MKQRVEDELEERLGLDVELGDKNQKGCRRVFVDGNKTECVFEERQIKNVMEAHKDAPVFEETIEALANLLKLELDQFDFDEKDYHGV